MKLWKRFNLKRKIQFFFLPLIIISIIIILILSVGLLVNNGKKEVINNTQDKLNLVRDQSDKIFENIRYNIKAFSTSSMLQDAIVTSHSDDMYGRYLLTSALHSSIYNIMDIDSLVSDGIIQTNNQVIYHINNEEITYDAAFSQQQNYKKIINNRGKIAIAYTETKENNSTLRLTKAIIHINSGELLGIIDFNLKEKIFREAYEGIKNDTDATFYLCDLQGRIISTSDSTLLGTFLPKSIMNDIKLNGNSYRQIMDNTTKKIVFSEKLNTEPFMVVSVIDQNRVYANVKPLAILLVCIGLILILVTMLLSEILARTLTTPLKTLINLTKEVGTGNVVSDIDNNSKDEIGELSRHFETMITNIQSLTTEKYHEQEKQKEYELRLLQAQINPHFLYNCLDNISTLIECNEQEKSLLMIQHLAHYYQHILSKGRNIIKLEEEISLTKNYLEIQLIRNPQLFSYQFNVMPEIENYHCLKLLLQPIVENSIMHGFSTNSLNNYIDINIHTENNNIIMAISDNGRGFDLEKLENVFSEENPRKSKHFGLKSIQERIQLKYGSNFGLTISSVPYKQTTVTLTFPNIL